MIVGEDGELTVPSAIPCHFPARWMVCPVLAK